MGNTDVFDWRRTDRRAGWVELGWVVIVLGAIAGNALAQSEPAPTPEAVLPDGLMPTPPAMVPPTELPAPVTGATPREAQLEERVRQLESMVQQLSTQINQITPPAAASPPAAGGTTGGTATPDTGTPAEVVAPSAMGGSAAPGQSLPPNPPPSPGRFDMPAPLENKKANVKFGPGFEIRTDDEEFIFQFHNLTQFDYRGYEQGGQHPVHDTFAIPRQWWVFSGRITKPWGYLVSFSNGFDTFSLLDVFIDADYDPRLRLRMGRFKTPFTYEFPVEPIQGLISPERSLFFNNFALNRDTGMMAFGRLFDNRIDYAAGIFNATRNGYVAINKDAKAVAAFLNYMPFRNEEGSVFENYNIGGSVMAANMDNPPIPQTFRTLVPTSGNAVAGVPFLALNPNVIESGPMAFWDLHSAWFYKGLALVGEWATGTQRYALSPTPRVRTAMPVQSFYIQMGYLLTGETRSGFGVVKPLRPFDIRKGKVGWGAWEFVTRFQYLELGEQVFTSGLADPNLWANQVNVVDVGFNWHLNQYLKFYFQWEHAEFNQPVLFAPGREQLNSDMFLARFQLFF